jgi:hypothetical protein
MKCAERNYFLPVFLICHWQRLRKKNQIGCVACTCENYQLTFLLSVGALAEVKIRFRFAVVTRPKR